METTPIQVSPVAAEVMRSARGDTSCRAFDIGMKGDEFEKKNEVILTDISPPNLTDMMDAGIRNGGFFVKVFTCERREGFVYPPISLVHAQVLHGEHGTSTPTAAESSETLLWSAR